MSFTGKMREASQRSDVPPPDPWRKPLEEALRGVEGMSTAALLDVVGAPPERRKQPSPGGDHAVARICSDPVTAVRAGWP